MTDKDAVMVSRLVKQYGTLTAVQGASFTVTKNEIFALLGPNGAGKTPSLRSSKASDIGATPVWFRSWVWIRGRAAPPDGCGNRSGWCCRTSRLSPT